MGTGPETDTYITDNSTANATALDVQNAGLYILGGNASTELVVDSESEEVALVATIFPSFFFFFFFPTAIFSFTGSDFSSSLCAVAAASVEHKNCNLQNLLNKH